jgi:ABC-type antimicrobial peptide transport system permease subunit
MLASVPTVSISVRTANDTASSGLRRAIAEAVTTVDPALSLSFIAVADQLSAQYVRERLLAILSGFFGGVALLLASLGLYGVTAHAVSRRRMEIGIRMALGASATAVERAVLARVAVLSMLGIAIGVIAAVWAGRAVETLLYRVSARDPLTIGGSALALTTIAIAAGWLPARRAARIDPAAVLREAGGA